MEKEKGKKYFPKTVSWIITTQCNMKCLHCYVPSGLETYELNFTQVRITIDNLSKMGVNTLILSGGEPLLRKDILDICNYATTKGLYISICTNGSMLSEDLVQKLRKCNLFNITVSLDSWDHEIHDELRDSKGAFKMSYKGIKTCLENKIRVFIDTTITRLNYRSIEKIIPFCSSLGVSLIMFRRFIPIGRGAKNIEKLAIPPEEYISSLNKCIKQNLLYRNIDIAFHDIAFKMFMLKKIFRPIYLRYLMLKTSNNIKSMLSLNLNKPADARQIFKTECHNRGCPAGLNWMGIMPNGDLRACPILPIRIGNILDSDIANIWHKSDVIYELKHRGKLKGKCGTCNLKRMCSGCRVYGFTRNSDYLEEDIFCRV